MTIEIRRKIGSFYQSHEVSLANTHLSTITVLISQSISTDSSERLAKLEQTEADKKNKEDDLKEKIEEDIIMAQEEKENKPLLYYTKQTVFILLSIGFIGGTIFMLYKFFTK